MPADVTAGETLVLGELVAEAQANNPSLASMKNRYEAAAERVPQAGALEDPRLFMGFRNAVVDGFAFDKEPMTMKEVGVSQMFPFYGKRDLRSEAASHESDAQRAEYEDGRLALVAEVKKVYFELYTVKKSLEIVDKNVELADVMKKVAESRYSVGKGSLKDIIKAQLETSMLLDRRITLERDGRTKLAYLGSLLGRDMSPDKTVEDITPTDVTLDRQALRETAGQARPAVRSANERIQSSAARVELARKGFYPDFEVMLSYGQRETLENGTEQSDMVSAMVTMNIPIWWESKLKPALREAATEKAMAERDLDAVMTRIYYRIDSLAAEVEQDDRSLRLYRDVVIPQATEDLDAALAGYEVGRDDFMTLVEARRTLFDYEIGYYMMLAEREKAVAELESVVGREF